jgi:hypothetical protein
MAVALRPALLARALLSFVREEVLERTFEHDARPTRVAFVASTPRQVDDYDALGIVEAAKQDVVILSATSNCLESSARQDMVRW